MSEPATYVSEAARLQFKANGKIQKFFRGRLVVTDLETIKAIDALLAENSNFKRYVRKLDKEAAAAFVKQQMHVNPSAVKGAFTSEHVRDTMKQRDKELALAGDSDAVDSLKKEFAENSDLVLTEAAKSPKNSGESVVIAESDAKVSAPLKLKS